MQFAEQHIEAIAPTVVVANKVSAGIFDDKVRRMGRTGNWFARFGQVSEWLVKTNERTKKTFVRREEEEP